MINQTKAAKDEVDVDLDTVRSGVDRLFHLLDAVSDILLEMNYVRDGKRDEELDRVASLVFIARDNARRTTKAIDDNYHAIKRGGWIQTSSATRLVYFG